MKKIEKILDLVTYTKTNMAIATVSLLCLGYIIGFVAIKLV